MRPLSAHEGRVLAVLVEKQHTVPDTYPMSLNAVAAGCNQKTARAPVLELADADVLDALHGLKSLSLVVESSGGRVQKFEHNAARVLGAPGAAVALLATLLLRGPLTAAELRLQSERLHRFADVSSVEGFLDELAARTSPLATKLPRMPGAREQRWAQLLCGDVAVAHAAADSAPPPADALAALRDELAALQDRVAALEQRLAAG